MQELIETGVDCSRLKQVKGDETAFTHTYIDEKGDDIIIGGGESAIRQTLHDDDWKYLENTKIVHSSAYASPEVIESLDQHISDSKIFSFDLASGISELRSRGYKRSQIEQLLPDLDLFSTNLIAAQSFFDADSVGSVVEELHSRGIERGVVTMGSQGAVLLNHGESIKISPVDVDILDTVGAGDAFIAGLLHGWIVEDWSASRAGKFASGLAAITCTGSGAQGKLPTADEVWSLLG